MNVIEKVMALYPEFTKIHGPYTCNRTGRCYYNFYNKNIKLGQPFRTKKIHFAKLVLEVKINRRLVGDEEADHIDNNPLNDTPDNLQVLSRINNTIKRHEAARIIVKKNCAECGKEIIIPPRDRRRHQDPNKEVFCNNSCKTVLMWERKRSGK